MSRRGPISRPPSSHPPGWLVVILVAVVSVASAQESTGADGAGKAKPRKSCFFSGCHTDLKEEETVHGPVSAGLCDACHTPDEGDHAWKLARSEESLCTFCHSIDSGRFVHGPVAQKNCLECHDPHQAANRALLVAEPAKLCRDCHERPEHDYFHEPFEEGNCLACHVGHASDHPRLLATGEKKLCLGCHDEFREELAAAQFVHAPAQDDCGTCHAAHGSKEEYLLKSATDKLCFVCHEDILSEADPKELAAAERRGVPVRDCLACHTAHVSSDSRLLAGGAREACLECHGGLLEGGEDVPADVDSDSSAKRGHGECTDCHSVHGPSGHGALIGEFPDGVYARFHEDAYSLCFECHPEEGMTSPVTTATMFRDGERNLHRVHVVEPLRGRTCRICHDVHGSARHALLRKSFPYGKGQWNLPIDLEITAERRTCAPGCHNSRSYTPGSTEREPSTFMGPQQQSVGSESSDSRARAVKPHEPADDANRRLQSLLHRISVPASE